MTDDVVAELRNWVTDWNGAAMVRGEPPRDGIHCDVLYDAIDEIVRLRATLERHDRLVVTAVVVATPAIRDDALEEAARVCDDMARSNAIFTWPAAAIRALKDK